MARKRENHTPGIQARILALMGAGGTAESIAAQLIAEGVKGVSRATIGRRMRELRGLEQKAALTSPVPGRRAAPAAPKSDAAVSAGASDDAPLPETPEEIPAGTGLETYDLWLRRAEEMYKSAKGRNDDDGMLKAGRLSQMYMEGKRKATPVAPPDPNDDPDMIAMGARVLERFRKLIDQAAP